MNLKVNSDAFSNVVYFFNGIKDEYRTSFKRKRNNEKECSRPLPVEVVYSIINKAQTMIDVLSFISVNTQYRQCFCTKEFYDQVVSRYNYLHDALERLCTKDEHFTLSFEPVQYTEKINTLFYSISLQERYPYHDESFISSMNNQFIRAIIILEYILTLYSWCQVPKEKAHIHEVFLTDVNYFVRVDVRRNQPMKKFISLVDIIKQIQEMNNEFVVVFHKYPFVFGCEQLTNAKNIRLKACYVYNKTTEFKIDLYSFIKQVWPSMEFVLLAGRCMTQSKYPPFISSFKRLYNKIDHSYCIGKKCNEICEYLNVSETKNTSFLIKQNM